MLIDPTGNEIELPPIVVTAPRHDPVFPDTRPDTRPDLTPRQDDPKLQRDGTPYTHRDDDYDFSEWDIEDNEDQCEEWWPEGRLNEDGTYGPWGTTERILAAKAARREAEAYAIYINKLNSNIRSDLVNGAITLSRNVVRVSSFDVYGSSSNRGGGELWNVVSSIGSFIGDFLAYPQDQLDRIGFTEDQQLNLAAAIPGGVDDLFVAALCGMVKSGRAISSLSKIENAFDGASELITVRTYTGAAGREGITSSGALRADTWVTLPGEIPSRAGHLQIEKMLEIQPGRGTHFLEFPIPSSNLRVPANGPKTSGGALQFQLNDPFPISPSTFRRPPGRPGG